MGPGMGHGEGPRNHADLAGAQPARLERLDVKIEPLKSNPELRAAIIEQLYQGYEQAFPDPDERYEFDDFKAYCEKPSGNVAAVLFNGQPIGGSMFRILETPSGVKFGTQAYIWIDEDYRSNGSAGMKGLFSLLQRAVEKTMNDAGCVAIMGENNDPLVMTDEQIAKDLEAGLHPSDRMKILASTGRVTIDAPYVQPGLSGGEPVTYLKATIKFFAGNPPSIPGALYKAMVTTYWSNFVPDVENSPEKLALDQMIPDGIHVPLIPMEQPRRTVVEQNNGTAWYPDDRLRDCHIPLDDLDPVQVLMELYKRVSVLGLGALAARPGPLSYSEADSILRENKYIDYLHGKPLKVLFLDGKIQPTGFDSKHGPGSLRKIIEELKAQPAKD